MLEFPAYKCKQNTMPAVPKRQRSKKRQRQVRNAGGKNDAPMPILMVLPSGAVVPANVVTPENPFHKGVKFLRSKIKKKKAA